MPRLEQAVCEWTANPLVEQNKHQGDFVAFIGQPVSVTPAVTFDQTVGFHLADVVTELGERVCRWLQTEAGEEGLVDFGGAPPGDLRSALWRSTSITRIIRVSWTLMPGIFARPTAIGSARR